MGKFCRAGRQKIEVEGLHKDRTDTLAEEEHTMMTQKKYVQEGGGQTGFFKEEEGSWKKKECKGKTGPSRKNKQSRSPDGDSKFDAFSREMIACRI